MKLELGPTDLRVVAEETVALMSTLPTTRAVVRLLPGSPAITLAAATAPASGGQPRRQRRQVHATGGRVQVDTEIDGSACEVLVRVRDNGRGIPAEAISRIGTGSIASTRAARSEV